MVKNLPAFDNKIKISVRRIIKIFGPLSGAVSKLAEIINAKNWKSSWVLVLLRAEEYSWFQVEKIFWKICRDNVVVIPDENQEDDADSNNFCLKNDLYNLRFGDQKILRSPTAWLNNRIMDVAQKLICNELGIEYQSVLNVQKSRCPPFNL